MLNLSKKTKIYLATMPTDMRKQMTGLAIVVREGLGRDPASGEIFVFRNRRGDMARVLLHDEQGYCLLSKRLDSGVFAGIDAQADETQRELTVEELARFLKALEFDKRHGG